MSFYRNPVALVIQAALAVITAQTAASARDPNMDWAFDPTARFIFRTFEHEGVELHRISLGMGRCVVLEITDTERGYVTVSFFRRQLAYEMTYHNVTSSSSLIPTDVTEQEFDAMNLYLTEDNIQENYRKMAESIYAFLCGNPVTPQETTTKEG